MVESLDRAIEDRRVKPIAASMSTDCIARIENMAGTRLPLDYVDFLSTCNGCTPSEGAFAIGIDDARMDCPYDSDCDVLIEELFCFAEDHDLDLAACQHSYKLNDWAPRHVISIGWTPAVCHLLLDLTSGGIYGWSIPGDERTKYGDIDWNYWADKLADNFSECWTKMRIVSSPW